MKNSFFNYVVRSISQSAIITGLIWLSTYIALSLVQFQFDLSLWAEVAQVALGGITILIGTTFSIMIFVYNESENL